MKKDDGAGQWNSVKLLAIRLLDRFPQLVDIARSIGFGCG
tara:strand:+ start:7189 stop:7308 length:120 start_codon:yes stop_codon:yes gene_type:complete